MNEIAIVSADYDEWLPQTLRGFVVDDDKRFDTFDEAYAYAESLASQVYKSSTVDHYKQDIARNARGEFGKPAPSEPLPNGTYRVIDGKYVSVTIGEDAE